MDLYQRSAQESAIPACCPPSTIPSPGIPGVHSLGQSGIFNWIASWTLPSQIKLPTLHSLLVFLWVFIPPNSRICFLFLFHSVLFFFFFQKHTHLDLTIKTQLKLHFMKAPYPPRRNDYFLCLEITVYLSSTCGTCFVSYNFSHTSAYLLGRRLIREK